METFLDTEEAFEDDWEIIDSSDIEEEDHRFDNQIVWEYLDWICENNEGDDQDDELDLNLDDETFEHESDEAQCEGDRETLVHYLNLHRDLDDYGVDEDEQVDFEEYVDEYDDDLIPWSLRSRFKKQRMRKLSGKRHHKKFDKPKRVGKYSCKKRYCWGNPGLRYIPFSGEVTIDINSDELHFFKCWAWKEL